MAVRFPGITVLDDTKLPDYQSHFAAFQVIPIQASVRDIIKQIEHVNSELTGGGARQQQCQTPPTAFERMVDAAYKGDLHCLKYYKTRGFSLDVSPFAALSLYSVAAVNTQNRVIAWLLEENVSVHVSSTSSAVHPLWVCCYEGWTATGKLLLQKGADVNWQDSKGRTALMAAAQGGHINILQILLEHGARLEQESHRGHTALDFALCNKQKSAVEYILKESHASGKQRGLFSSKSLLVAVAGGSLEVLKFLQGSGYNLNQTSESGGITPLMLACYLGYKEMVMFLSENQSNINQTNIFGMTAFMYGCLCHTSDVVQYLYNHFESKELQLSAIDNHGNNGFILCAASGNTDWMRVLLPHIDIDTQNSDGTSALMVASKEGHATAVLLLLEKSADVVLLDRNGMSALCLAYAHQHSNVIEVFKQFGMTLYSLKVKTETKVLSALCGKDHTIGKDLLLNGCSANVTNHFGETPLMIASFLGDLEMMKLLLTRRCNINARNKDGCSAMEYAANANHPSAVDFFLGRGFEINQKDPLGKTILHRSVLSGNKTLVTRVLNLGVQINSNDNDSNTALLISVQKGFEDIALMLIALGADTSIRNKEDLSALDYAFVGNHLVIQSAIAKQIAEKSGDQIQTGQRLLLYCENQNQEEVEKLISQINDAVNYYDPLNLGAETPLFRACKQASLRMASLLYKYGANINTINVSLQDQGTALIVPVVQNNVEMLKWLIRCGAYINFPDILGLTPLMYAARENHLDALNSLVEAKVLLNVKDVRGFTALLISVINKRNQIVTALLKAGAFVDITECNGDTPLKVASKRGHLGIVKLLVQHTANVNLANIQGSTPLMSAAAAGHLEIVQFLTAHGADIDAVATDGHTAQDRALHYGHTLVVEWFQQHRVANVTDPLSRLLPSQTNRGHTETTDENLYEPMSAQDSNKNNSSTDNSNIAGQGMDDTDKVVQRKVIHVVMDDTDKVVQGKVIHVTTTEDNKDNRSTRFSQLGLAEHLDQSSLERLLSEAMSNGENVNQENANGETPLFVAVKCKNYELIEHLLQLGADVNHKDNYGKTVIHLYAEDGERQDPKAPVSMLITSGANLNTKDCAGVTPLHASFLSGNMVIANLLIDHGAKVEECSPEVFPDVGNIFDAEPLKILLRHGARSKHLEKTIFGSALCAIAISNIETVYLLLEYLKHSRSYEQVERIIAHIKLCDWDKRLHTKCTKTGMIESVEPARKCFAEVTDLVVAATDKNRNAMNASCIALKYGQYEAAHQLSEGELIIADHNYRLEKVYHQPKEEKRDIFTECNSHDSSALDLEYNSYLEKLHSDWQNMIDNVYQVVVTAFIKYNPGFISGMSRHWQQATVNIHTLESSHMAANSFIQSLEHHNRPYIDILTLRPLTQQKPAFLLTGDETDYRRRCKNEAKTVTMGSLISRVLSDSFNDNSPSSCLNQMKTFGTITGFLQSSDNLQQHWLLTVLKCWTSEQDVMQSETKTSRSEVLSEYIAPSTNITTSCIVGRESNAVCTVKSCRSVCLNVTKITEAVPVGSLTNGLIKCVYEGTDRDLVSQTVHKTGASSGRTTGVIINANTSVRSADGHCYHGTFVVSTSNPASCFAVPGDIGALVCDDSETIALGILVAAQRNYCLSDSDTMYHHVVFCLRIDRILDYLKEKLHLNFVTA